MRPKQRHVLCVVSAAIYYLSQVVVTVSTSDADFVQDYIHSNRKIVVFGQWPTYYDSKNATCRSMPPQVNIYQSSAMKPMLTRFQLC